jgi:hypothetical protein
MDAEVLKKLRYKEGRALVLNAPEGYGDGLPTEAQPDEKYDFLLLFVNSAKEAGEWLPRITELPDGDAVFWIAYPKQQPKSKLKPDVNRDILAAIVQEGSPYRPVSNVAIDEKWSALRFRLKELVKSSK